MTWLAPKCSAINCAIELLLDSNQSYVLALITVS